MIPIGNPITYPYMTSLNTLSSGVNPQALPLPSPLSDIVTPLKLEYWAIELSTYSDELSVIKHGFRIGCDYANYKVVTRGRSMSSAVEHTEVVDEYLALEKAQGRVGILPSSSTAAKACHVSPFGVIPMKSKPGK